MTVPFEQFTAQKVPIAVTEYVCQRMLAAMSRAEVTAWQDQMGRRLGMRIDTYIHGMPGERIVIHRQWPRTWWDAFKERWFPAWAKDRWPVEYDSIDVDEQRYLAVCPHLQDDPRDTHLRWMALKADQSKGTS